MGAPGRAQPVRGGGEGVAFATGTRPSPVRQSLPEPHSRSPTLSPRGGLCFALREGSEQVGIPPGRSPLLYFKKI